MERASVPSAKFLVNAANLEILKSPAQFQQLLNEGIEYAKRRIGIITLYVGAEQEDFFKRLFERSQEGVEVHLLADYCRTLRPERQKNTSQWRSSLDTMRKLHGEVIRFEKTAPQISLFHVPRRFQGQQLFPYRMQETLGVAHWKYYIFDNDVILTGANIAQSYLTNRMDRWLILRNEPEFVDFLWKLASTLRCHSNSVTFTSQGEHIADPEKPVIELCPALERQLEMQPPVDSSERNSESKALLHWGIQCGFDPTPERRLAESEQFFIGDALARPASANSDTSIDEAASTQDEGSTVEDSPTAASRASSIVLASPYLNLPPPTIGFLSKKIEGQSLHIIGASPDASSFFQGGPVLSAVPWAYLSLTCKALSLLGNRVRVRYFSFAGQGKRTFHAKGVWNDGTALGQPYKTLLGSTNMSERSVKRDLECLCVLETRNPKLIDQFRQEVGNIKKVTRAPRSLGALLCDLYEAPFLTRMISKLFVHNPFLRSIL
eukprot:Gregarina_sp_Pseudo_9__723@NODE_1461_length_1581_cov_25_284695_g1357_i0_p1_GENE_NODE_1461_length_1581_cov_25_284695_g1357_i0NODE_1461_length_1581_cov_25_284695_g1357_i0_p1_ORF_typecomplete_len492_score42_71PLDc_2/PF13091_6/2_2e11PLDc_2/PF13091_6/9_1e07RE_NgoFVII/PF09565_10/0_19RE_NgoFVII/PF09565_10/7_3_NODE_1461_length_1581_cov_25_284695_g1357_i0731548